MTKALLTILIALLTAASAQGLPYRDAASTAEPSGIPLTDFILDQTRVIEDESSKREIALTLICEPVAPEAASEALMAQTRDALAARLEASRFSEALVEIVDGWIAVTIVASEDDPHPKAAELRRLIEAEGQMEFRDPDGAVFMDESALADAATCYASDFTHFAVLFRLTPEGTEAFGEVTRAGIGRQISIYLDGELVFAPTVQAAITDGEGMISNSDTASEYDSYVWAADLAAIMKAQPLPLALVVTAEEYN